MAKLNEEQQLCQYKEACSKFHDSGKFMPATLADATEFHICNLSMLRHLTSAYRI